MPGYVTLGTDVETGQPVRIGEIQRCGGVYLLGRARTGKSNTLISTALQDIERGIGVLFIDPHADAIQAILDRLPGNRIDDVILLDPTDNDYSFGINPLYCANPHNLQERQLTFGQTWDVFAKVFAEENERLGILLSKYLGNCLYPLIEHQGYTLYDLWDFLLDESFREFILSKVTYHPEVVRFWHVAYDRLPTRDKIGEPESLLNRLDSLQRNPYIKHVISQARPRIDFVEVLAKQKIVLLRLPPWQDSESRTFIGTLVISQLLKAIFLRAEVAEHLRTPFAIYCDEFQLFATPDFAKLFTQTGKYWIMPTVGHQDREGQFKPNDPNRGATLAAPIKMIFRSSVPDSHEIAPELAKDSPTEIRFERQLVISDNPVKGLLRGHTNPDIRNFVNVYLRPLVDHLDDTKAMMEGQRIGHMVSTDEAALYRGYERQANVANERESTRLFLQREALGRAEGALMEALDQSTILLRLFERSHGIEQTLRYMNTFLTALMEGRIAPGQEAFSDFLIQRVRESALVPAALQPVIALYISLRYGSPHVPRTIPVTLAAKYNLTSVDKVYKDIEAEYQRQVLDYCEKQRRENEEDKRSKSQLSHDVAVRTILTWRHQTNFLGVPVKKSRQSFQLLQHKPIHTLLEPYFFAKFCPPWYYDEKTHLSGQIDEPRINDQEGLMVFIRQYGEGAWVTLFLLNLLYSEWQRYGSNNYIKWNQRGSSFSVAYLNLQMLNLPAIAGKEPFQVWQLLRQIATIASTIDSWLKYRAMIFNLNPHRRYGPGGDRNIGDAREDAILLSDVLQKQGKNAKPGAWWSQLDEQTQNYLIFRASDLVTYGEVVADRTFPQPTLPGITPQQLTGVVTTLMKLLIEAQMEKKAELDQTWVSRKEALLKESMWKNKELLAFQAYNEVHQVAKTELSGLYHPPRVLTTNEIETLKPLCLGELPQHQGILATIDAFVHFCRLLSRPENHIKVASEQYIEQQVKTYSTQEMINQMGQELSRLPRGTAYATILQEVNDTQIVQTVKIQTARIAEAHTLTGVGEIVKRNAIAREILRKRSDIDKEIIARQAQWRGEPDNDPPSLPPPSGGKSPTLPPKRSTRKSTPPPTHYVPGQTPDNTVPESKTEQVQTETGKRKKAGAKSAGKIIDITPALRQREAEESKNNTQEKLDALQEKLIPIVRQYMLQYEEKAKSEVDSWYDDSIEEENIRKALACALALRDKVAVQRLLPKIENVWFYDKELLLARSAILMGDEARAEKIMEFIYIVYLADLAAEIPSKTTAKKRMLELEARGLIGLAAPIAVSIGDKETILRIMQTAENKGFGYLRDTGVLTDLAPFQPELAKKLMKLLENDPNDKLYMHTAGEIAAVLGDIDTANRIIMKLRNQRRYKAAAFIAGMVGDIVVTEELMWEDKKQDNEEYWWDNCDSFPISLAPYNPDAAYHIMNVLKKNGHDDIGEIAAVILENLRPLS